MVTTNISSLSGSFAPATKRQRLDVMQAQLEAERASFMPHWRDLGDYIMPRRPRFSVTDVNKGQQKNNKIIDSTATLAVRTLRSGMMSGVTSPARPWFRLSTPDPDLAEFGPVKEWLFQVTRRMQTVFLKSNLYNVLPILYGDIGTFATAAMMMEEDFTGRVIRFYPFPIGSYSISNNDQLKVDVFTREFRYTVRQLVSKFGVLKENGQPDWSIFSDAVKNYWDSGAYETWIDICHAITPNSEQDPSRLESKFLPYASTYYEKGIAGNRTANSYPTNNPDVYLRERGYELFPVVAPRWEVNGEDVWGTSCPGMVALGDTKQLQLGERRAAQLIEKMVKPPMTGPTALMSRTASILPGDITYVDVRDGQKGFQPAHEIRDPHLDKLEGKQQQIRQRISRAFYEDLFLMLATDPRKREITAREIEERHEEKLLALGPVLEQLNQDLLDPLIDTTYAFMDRQGLIPPPPPDLAGQDLKVEYISIMAQAQKLVGIAGIERFSGFVSSIAKETGDPTVLYKVDIDRLIEIYGDMTSIPPEILNSEEEVVARKNADAKARQVEQTAMLAKEASIATKNLSQSNMGGDTALARVAEGAGAV